METLLLYYELMDWLVMCSFITEIQLLEAVLLFWKEYHYGNINFNIHHNFWSPPFIKYVISPYLLHVSSKSVFSIGSSTENQWCLLSVDFTSHLLGWGNPFPSLLTVRPLRRFCRQQGMVSLHSFFYHPMASSRQWPSSLFPVVPSDLMLEWKLHLL